MVMKKVETVCQIPANQLKPNPWGLEVGPTLSDEDEQNLDASIKKDGVQIPLIVWKKGKSLIVLSGMNRLRLAKKHGLKTVPVIIREYADQHAAKLFAVSDNLARRQLSIGQRAYLAYQYQELLTVGRGKRTDLQLSTNLSKVDTRGAAAKRSGVSEGTISSMKMVVESGNGELLQSVLSGERSVHAAAYTLRSNGRPHRPARLSVADQKTRKDATTLIRGDCRTELKKIASRSVDAIITDPIYPCIDRAYGRISEAEWLTMMKTVVHQCRRVLKPKGSAVFIIQPNYKTVGTMRLWAWRLSFGLPRNGT